MDKSTGKNPSSLRGDNVALIIRLLRERGILSRVALSRLTGLSQVAITNIISDLLDKGMIYETGALEGSKGRRSVGITLNDDFRHFIGVRINRDYFTAGIFNMAGRLQKQLTESIDSLSDPKDVLRRLKNALAVLLEASRAPVSGIGMALPGPLFPREGKVLLMSGFPGWNIVNVKEELDGLCRSHGLALCIEHDANCGVLAERWYGAENIGRTTLYLVIDRGIGCGLMIDGSLYSGSNGMSGELGHVSIDYNGPTCECGNRGCLELYCSTKAIEDEYKRRRALESDAQSVPYSLEDIVEAANNGDETAYAVVGRAARFLGIGIVGIINVLNPDTIILSDKISEAGEMYFSVLRKTLKNRLLPEIYENLNLRTGSRFDCDPMLVGAGALVFEKLLESPVKYFLDG